MKIRVSLDEWSGAEYKALLDAVFSYGYMVLEDDSNGTLIFFNDGATTTSGIGYILEGFDWEEI